MSSNSIVNQQTVDILNKFNALKKEIESRIVDNYKVIQLDKNPFPIPDGPINDDVMYSMNILLSRKELTLYTFFEKIEAAAIVKDHKTCLVWAYYLFNLLNNKQPEDKMVQLNNLYDLLNSM